MGFDQVGIFAGIQAFIELLGIQIKIRSKLFQIVFVESPLVFPGLVVEEIIMIFPESTLVSSAFTGFRSPLRFRPQECEMPVSETNFAGLNVIFIDLTPRVSGKSAAVRSLVIAELDHCDRGIRISFEVVSLPYQELHQSRCADR